MKLGKYLFLWKKTTTLSFETILASKGAALMYLIGKFVRFFFFLWLLLRLGEQIQLVSGFTVAQLVTFFLVFNLFDMVGQILFRGVYWFREQVVSGKLDLTLLKPASAIFQILTNRTDLLDVPLLFVVVFALIRRGIGVSLETWLIFIAMSGVSLVLITAVHVTAAAIGVLTTEVDHTMMIYRDLSAMARLPIDIYAQFLRILLTFVIPIAVMMTFPAKAFLGLLTWPLAAFGVVTALFLFWLSIRLWCYALTKYSSASS